MIPIPLVLFGASILASALAGPQEEDQYGGTGSQKPRHRTLGMPGSGLLAGQQGTTQDAGQPPLEPSPQEKTAEEAMNEILRKIDSEFMADMVGDEVADDLFEDAVDR